MKKVISILVALALVLSCCSVAVFAAATSATIRNISEKTSSYAAMDLEALANYLVAYGLADEKTDPDAPLDDQDIANILAALVGNGTSLTLDMANWISEDFKLEGLISADQETAINNEVQNQLDNGTYAKPAGSGEEGGGEEGGGEEGGGESGGGIGDILSNLGNLDISKFTEGAKSALGQLLDGLKGAGIDLSNISGLLGGLGGIGDLLGGLGGGGDILSTIMGLFGGLFGGGDDGSSTTPSPTPGTPGGSTGYQGGTSNTTTIPNTADTAPIVAVASLAVLAGVAFVLTRKKNND